MVKDIATILKELGINLESETLLEDTINKLLEYSVVNENELLGIQNVSVQPLPTIIKNDEKNLKQRMVGIVSDQEKGAVSIINKRTVLLTKIIEALKNKVESFTDLGEINTTPTSEENDVLNNIKTKGVYSFNLSGFQYIMLVNTKRRKTLTGFIRVYEQYIFDGSRIIVRITNDSIDYWAVETNHIASKSDLDETKQEILNTLDTRLGNFKWLGDTNQDPSQTNNTFLNNVTKPGFYAYNVYGTISFMTVDNYSAQTGPNTSITIVTQHIFSTDRRIGNETIDNVDGRVTHTIRTLTNNVWEVKTEYLATEQFIKQIENELLNKIAQINNDLSNLNNVKADKTELDNYLLKTGGTVGSLNVNGNINVNGSGKVYINNKEVATKEHVAERIAQLIGSAPETLDTLDEIAEALKDNEDIVDVLNQSIATKADKSYVDDMWGNLNIYDYTYSTNPYVENDTLYLENITVKDGTLMIRNGSVIDNTLYL